MEFGPLVDAAWLRSHLHDPDVRIIDFRWYLLGRKGRDEYERGHIPGAVFVDLESVTGEEGGGRHPLPSAQLFAEEMQRAGVSSSTRVVVYDDSTASPTATRLWFMLGLFGHRAQAVLDGGLQAWASPLASGTQSVERGNFTSTEADLSRVVDWQAVRALRGVPLIDARVGERYRGETEPIDPKAGHIPGARNLPYTENLAPGGRFKTPDELRRQFEALGVRDGAVFYCGSGVNATQQVLAMEIAGLPNARLYAGSWSDWSNRDLPVATGADP
ncbi:MAG TPA: sulfurtransferase [Candidatus Dormibacteraeota bacterium]|nr:sulfurtransferase [Candidatus Dormibacteraeota bacterium]